jgi:single-stranded-DNA-specific exonuclease
MAWRQRQRFWRVAPAFDGAADLARQLGTSPLVAQVLHNRNASTLDAARDFLQPRMDALHDPRLMPNIEVAASRLAQAVRDRQHITLYGDYDVDGMTGLAILRNVLAAAGASVEYYVPHRLEEGYGVNADALRKILAGPTKLIVTVDCGIGGAEALDLARQAGVDVIVTDHHQLPERLPNALAIVHPALPGCGYPNPDLSGSGVAFKLAWQLARTLAGRDKLDAPMRELLLESMCLAALGIIADVVPLLGENRIFAAYGLKALPTTKHVGLRALIDCSGLAGRSLDTYDVGFMLAPRLNACGRMGHAALAVELLTTAPPQRSIEIAQYLSSQNEQRQKVEREIVDQAAAMVRERGMDRDDCRAIVLAGESWHAGVIGIVASRLVEQFHRPTVLIALDGDAGQGSGRSVPGFNLHEALVECSVYLRTFGGHAMAAGLRIDKAKVDDFAAAMNRCAMSRIEPAQLQGVQSIDAEATVRQLDYNLAAHLGKLAPFGQGNPAPVLAFRDCRVIGQPKRIGRNGNTLCLTLGQDGATIRAIGFGMGDLVDELPGVNRIDVAAEATINTFNGRTSVELKLRDVHLPD